MSEEVFVDVKSNLTHPQFVFNFKSLQKLLERAKHCQDLSHGDIPTGFEVTSESLSGKQYLNEAGREDDVKRDIKVFLANLAVPS